MRDLAEGASRDLNQGLAHPSIRLTTSIAADIMPA